MSLTLDRIRFYSGYDYAQRVNQLATKTAQAIQWMDHPPAYMGYTARQLAETLSPCDEIRALTQTTAEAAQVLQTCTARLSPLVRLICEVVQRLVFHFMNTRMQMLANRISEDTLYAQEPRLADSDGLRIGVGPGYDLFVLVRKEPLEVKISLKNGREIASFWVHYKNIQSGATCLEVAQITPTENPDLQHRLARILQELLQREEAEDTWLFCNQAPAPIVKSAGLHKLPQTEGFWKHKNSIRLSGLATLPGEGPFLPRG